ncbi:hypothetical protein EDB19DRAFT_1743456 [Suillus lakei]|nr:hypothetical protein EDB19DRAFT_1743456 [Suillus lakei]
MGTRGYYVYRYRHMYFTYYNHWDSYPSNLGVRMIKFMRLPNAIAMKREGVDEILDEREGSPDESDDNLTISSRRPQNDLIIEWIYEIDLDRNIFHINGIPFFDLECLPDESAFIEYVSNSCGPNPRNMARKVQCPSEHKYKVPGPPPVGDSDLATYQSSACTGSHAALSDLLAVGDVLSPDEQVRVSLLETMIGQCMIHATKIGYDRPGLGDVLNNFELVPDRNQITDTEWLAACSMANFAFVPQLFGASEVYHPQLGRLGRKEFIWVREDTVVCIATHLDDERCLRASISRLITAVLEQKDAPGDYFGIAFSVFHCAIIKVVKDTHTTTFSHTTALQFLPSFSSDSPSTPGITALARLGHRIDPAVFARAMEVYRWPRSTTDKENSLAQEGNDAPCNVNCAALPAELWREIALHLDLQDVLTLGMVAKLCRGAASMVLHYPHVRGHRLVAVSKETPKHLLRDHRFLYAASFSAARAGVSTTVIVGWGNARKVYLPLGDLCMCVSGTDGPDTEQYRLLKFLEYEEEDEEDYEDDDVEEESLVGDDDDEHDDEE